MGQLFGGDSVLEGFVEVSASERLKGFEFYTRQEVVSALPAQVVQSTQRLVSPHFFFDKEGGDTEIRLLNAGSQSLSLRVRALNDVAKVLDSQNIQIAAKSLYVKTVSSLFSGISASTGYLDFEVTSSGTPRLIGAISFTSNRGRTHSTLSAIPAGHPDALLLHVAHSKPSNIFTGLSILNTSIENAQLTLTAFDQMGAKTAEKRTLLSPGFRIVGLLDSGLFFGSGFSQLGGHLRLSSTQPLATFAIFGDFRGEYFSAIEVQPLFGSVSSGQPLGFTGTYPKPASITVKDELGNPVTMVAFPGQISILTSVSTDAAAVENAVRARAGKVMAQIPELGMYWAEVQAGKESAFIDSIRKELFVVDSFPNLPGALGIIVTPTPIDLTTDDGRSTAEPIFIDGDVAVLDDFTALIPTASDTHGSCISRIINSTGTGPAVDISEYQNMFVNGGPFGTSDSLVSQLYRLGRGAAESKAVKILNISQHVTNSAQEQEKWLQSIFHAVSSMDPSVRKYLALSVIMGNSRFDLTAQVAKLRKNYPEAFKNIVLVGGLDESGAPDPSYNFSQNPEDLVYAPARQVPPCNVSGTSFAAPQVARLLAQLKKKFPDLTADQLIDLVRKNAPSGTRNVGSLKYKTMPTLDSILKEVFTLTIIKKGDGDGTITSSPAGIACGAACSGVFPKNTLVKLATEATLGSFFVGWSGDAGCADAAVTLDSNKTCTVFFQRSSEPPPPPPPSSDLTGRWKGNYELTVSVSAFCSNISKLTHSGDLTVDFKQSGGTFTGSGTVTGVKTLKLVGSTCSEDKKLSFTGKISGTVSGDRIKGKLDLGDPDLFINIVELEGKIEGNTISGDLLAPDAGTGTFSLTRQ